MTSSSKEIHPRIIAAENAAMDAEKARMKAAAALWKAYRLVDRLNADVADEAAPLRDLTVQIVRSRARVAELAVALGEARDHVEDLTRCWMDIQHRPPTARVETLRKAEIAVLERERESAGKDAAYIAAMTTLGKITREVI